MAKNTLVEIFLKESMTASAQELLLELKKNNIHVKRALWYYDESSEKWRLILALPGVNRMGSRPLYKKLTDIFFTGAIRNIDQFSITFLDISDSFFKNLTALSEVIVVHPSKQSGKHVIPKKRPRAGNSVGR